jgi:hypothetical protein
MAGLDMAIGAGRRARTFRRPPRAEGMPINVMAGGNEDAPAGGRNSAHGAAPNDRDRAFAPQDQMATTSTIPLSVSKSEGLRV